MIRQAGVTLIEIILVIAVASVMALVGINSLQRKVTDDRIERTVLQLQEIAAAARAYYLSYSGSWPASFQTMSEFLPAEAWDLTAPENAWGPKYIYTLTPPPEVSTTDSMLVVTTTVPGQYEAESVAGRLPNVDVSGAGNLYTLTLYVTIPANLTRYGHYILLKDITTQTVTSGSNTIDMSGITCPFGTEKSWAAGLESFSRSSSDIEWWSDMKMTSNTTTNTLTLSGYGAVTGQTVTADIVLLKLCKPSYEF